MGLRGGGEGGRVITARTEIRTPSLRSRAQGPDHTVMSHQNVAREKSTNKEEFRVKQNKQKQQPQNNKQNKQTKTKQKITKYFCSLKKRNFISKQMKKIVDKNGSVLKEPNAIMN